MRRRRARRRLADEHLTAVRERGDSRAAVDVDPDVAFRRHRRRARVHSHPDGDRAGGERRLSLAGGGESAARGWKSDEERVALRVDLDPAVRGERIPERAAVLGERLGVRLRPERVEQPRRAFDVREEERHRASRERGVHARSIALAVAPELGLRPGARRSSRASPMAPSKVSNPPSPTASKNSCRAQS